MTHVRSESGADLAGNPVLPASLNSEAPPVVTPAASQTRRTPEAKADEAEAGDHSVVLWDEVKAPEATETKPLDEDLPDDPAAH